MSSTPERQESTELSLRVATSLPGTGLTCNTPPRTRADAWPRRELFTPLRVAGAPPAKSVILTRITEGRVVDIGEAFRRVASWIARSSAHDDCRRRWTGRTRFLLRAGGDKELLEAGAGRLPAELEPRRTEDSQPRDGGRNKAKHVEASKANRVEAKVKKSSHHYIPARYPLESLRMRCSGC